MFPNTVSVTVLESFIPQLSVRSWLHNGIFVLIDIVHDHLPKSIEEFSDEYGLLIAERYTY